MIDITKHICGPCWLDRDIVVPAVMIDVNCEFLCHECAEESDPDDDPDLTP